MCRGRCVAGRGAGGLPGAGPRRSSPTATITASPTAGASPSPTVSTSSPDFYGLTNATLDLPARPAGNQVCPDGPHTQFVNGKSEEITQIAIATEADVDHDGALDVVAAIDCTPGEGSLRQLVAFHRRVDGTFATIGLVVQVDGRTPNSGTEIHRVFGMEITATGGVRVEVGDYKTTYTDPLAVLEGIHQFRTYSWNGTAFVQTAGSTSFVVPAGTVDLSVNASPMTYAKPVNGARAGTMTVAFHQPVPSSDPHNPVDEYADLQVRIGDQKYSDVQGVSLVYK